MKHIKKMIFSFAILTLVLALSSTALARAEAPEPGPDPFPYPAHERSEFIAEEPGPDPFQCEDQPYIEALLNEFLQEAIRDYDVVRIPGPMLNEMMRIGEIVEIPFINLLEEREMYMGVAQPYTARDESVETAVVKMGGQEYFEEPLPQINAYTIGCQDPRDGCGVITFLNEENTQYEGMVSDPLIGFAAIESVSSLLKNLTGEDFAIDPNCSIIYNGNAVAAIDFSEENDPTDNVFYEMGRHAEMHEAELMHNETSDSDETKEGSMLTKTINIVLDSDGTFYGSDKNTVWGRQHSVLHNVNLIYHWIEPATGGQFDIDFKIVGMESWLPNSGPTNTDSDKLTNEVNGTSYYMKRHPAKNEVSFFYVGYDLAGGIAGQAGGICNLPGYDDTYGSNQTHQKNHAIGQQVADASGYQFATLYGRSAVMAHEIAHMLGGTHGSGQKNACAGGVWPNVCGTTLMLSGAAGGVDPDYRQSFFSDANDKQIKKCVSEAK
ncbi:MAG: M12 family metallo-peptidase [bacterium]|nr:hypothetical protein [bacterium]MBU1918991.1 hypothetical protein [bacterium]